jgi:integrase
MLNRDVHRYLELQRSLGFKFRIQGSLLKNFVAFAEGHGDCFVQTSRAIEWAACAPSAPQRYNRLATVRRCALALHAEDARHEIPPSDVYGRQWFKRTTPYLFTPQEIAGLIEAARQLGPKHSIRPLTYATLFGLLAATGLRVSEALTLQLNDLMPDGLLIRATKFKKYAAPLAMSMWRIGRCDCSRELAAGLLFRAEMDRHSFTGYRLARNAASLLPGR